MLVTLGVNQTISASSSETFTYSPQSVQKVIVSMEDADWEGGSVTIQIGSTTVCNGIVNFGMQGINQLQTNTVPTGSLSGAIVYDLGSHQCLNADNLYVTINAVGELTATDVSAVVDEPFSGSMPIRLTEYSDNTFTSTNCLSAVCYRSNQGEINEDSANCEIKTKLYSSAPTFISSSSYFQANSRGSAYATSYGLLCKHQVPLDTTFNYTSGSVDRIITAEAMPSSQAQVNKSKATASIARRAVVGK